VRTKFDIEVCFYLIYMTNKR